jgi:hypothetical protein
MENYALHDLASTYVSSLIFQTLPNDSFQPPCLAFSVSPVCFFYLRLSLISLLALWSSCYLTSNLSSSFWVQIKLSHLVSLQPGFFLRGVYPSSKTIHLFT